MTVFADTLQNSLRKLVVIFWLPYYQSLAEHSLGRLMYSINYMAQLIFVELILTSYIHSNIIYYIFTRSDIYSFTIWK